MFAEKFDALMNIAEVSNSLRETLRNMRPIYSAMQGSERLWNSFLL